MSKHSLKKIIEKQYRDSMPIDFEHTLKNRVLQSIQKPLPWYSRIEKEDKRLFLAILVFCAMVYFFGFDSTYRISVSFTGEIVKNIGMGLITTGVVLYLAMNEYFDRKKNLHL